MLWQDNQAAPFHIHRHHSRAATCTTRLWSHTFGIFSICKRCLCFRNVKVCFISFNLTKASRRTVWLRNPYELTLSIRFLRVALVFWPEMFFMRPWLRLHQSYEVSDRFMIFKTLSFTLGHMHLCWPDTNLVAIHPRFPRPHTHQCHPSSSSERGEAFSYLITRANTYLSSLVTPLALTSINTVFFKLVFQSRTLQFCYS